MNNSFLRQVTEALIARGWDSLRNLTLVFPMQRAGLYAKLYMQEALQREGYTQPVVLPRMLTIDQLADDLSLVRTQDEIRAVCCLYDIYCAHTSDHLPLDAFYGWGRQLLQDFSNLDLTLPDAGRAIANMAEAQVLDEVELDEATRQQLAGLMNLDCRDGSVEAFFHDLWRQLPAIYADFTEQQRSQGVGTRGACLRWVVDHFDELLPEFEGRTFVFVGFNYLMPAERMLMQRLKDAGQALFFWDYDDSFHTDPSVYQYIRANMQLLGSEPLATPSPFKGEGRGEGLPVTAISTTSANAQAQYVGQWLLEHHRPGQRTAVVIADEQMLESVLYALPASLSRKVNITKGYPLRSTRIYSEVVSYLTDKAHDRRPDEPTYGPVLERLAASLQRPDALDSSDPSGLSGLSGQSGHPGPSYCSPQFRCGASGQSASAEVASWREILLAEAYCQTILVINRFLALIAEGVLSGITELRTLRNLLRRALDSVSLPFHGEPIEEVQIIGVLETRLLDFDNVLILNVEEGVVPGNAADRSFIPFDLRRAYGMQTHEEDARVYAYNFFRLIRRASHVSLMFSEAAGDMSKKSMSRFLMQMLISPDFEVIKRRIAEPSAVQPAAAVRISRTWADTAKERPVEQPDGTVRTELTLSLSPSALSEYIECPRRFYLRHIEGVEEPASETLLYQPNQLGSIFHGAVQAAYETIAGGPVHSLTAPLGEAILEHISGANWPRNAQLDLEAGYRDAIDEYNRRHPADPAGESVYPIDAHLAENEVIKQMLYQVLADDARRQDCLRMRLQEGSFYRTIRPEGSPYPISIGGRIDRMDVVRDPERQSDVLRIVDYKTGSFSSEKMKAASWEVLFANPDAHYVLQTLLYSSVCMAHQQELNPGRLPVVPELMFTQKLSADRHVSVGAPVLDFAEISAEFDEALSRKVLDILADTEFPMCDPTACSSFCPFHLLCSREKQEF